MVSGKKFYIETFGCQMNVHDSEKISGVLNEEGFSPAERPADSDLIVLNTCSIREKAEQKFFSELGRIKRLKRKNPKLKIAVAGCIAQQMGNEIFGRAPYVDFVFGPQNIHLLRNLIKTDKADAATEDNPEVAEIDLPVKRAKGGRAWVSIMYGCNNFCSYCIVPFTRGRERSRPSGNIIREIEDLVKGGFKEVTLLGQNVNSYRSDTGFPGLLEKVNGIEGIERIRFITSHPRDLSEELIGAMGRLEKVCEHIHLPLQSGSSSVLERMRRGYTYEDYLKKVNALRAALPGISITTDVITGFPGETEDDHRMTLKALEEIGYDGIFAFKFSPRKGTVAASMAGQVAEETKSERILHILELQDGITLRKNKSLEGSVQEVLVEGPSETDPERLTGRTRTNKIVNFKGASARVGQILHVRISRGRKHSLDGEAV